MILPPPVREGESQAKLMQSLKELTILGGAGEPGNAGGGEITHFIMFKTHSCFLKTDNLLHQNTERTKQSHPKCQQQYH